VGHSDNGLKDAVRLPLRPPDGAARVTLRGYVLVESDTWFELSATAFAVTTPPPTPPAPPGLPTQAGLPAPPPPQAPSPQQVAAAAPPTFPRQADPPAPALPGGASYCAPSGALCLSWAADAAAGTVTLRVSARAAGYAAIGFADAYGVMSPADVYVVWSDAAGGAGALSRRRNARGYDAPSVRTLPPGAALLACSHGSGGALAATFTLPLPPTAGAGGVVNLIWSVGAAVAPGAAATAPLRAHGDVAGVDYGAAAIDLRCTGAASSSCVLASGLARVSDEWRSFSRLHVIALAGLGATQCAAAAARAAAARLPPARLPLRLRRLGLGTRAADALLALGGAATAALYLREALRRDGGASPARALGALLAPACGVALLPVSRRGAAPWARALGAPGPHDRALAFHRVAGTTLVALVAAHAAAAARERGAAVFASRAPNASGDGPARGTAAAVSLALLALLSAPPVRHASWELFKLSHLTLAPLALALIMSHARIMIPYVVLPLALWTADYAWRAVVAAPQLRLARPPVLLPGGVLRLEVAVAGSVRVHAGAYALLQVPSVARSEWHPLSCVCAPGAPEEITFLLRAHGSGSSTAASFGARAAAAAASGALRCVRLDGCYGGPGLQLQRGRYACVLLVAGGVGITPFVSIAHALLAHDSTACGDSKAGPPCRVTLLWAVRHPHALSEWLPGVLPALAARAGCDVRVCVTGSGGAGEEEGGGVDGDAEGVRVSRGRPDVSAAVRECAAAAAAAGGAAAVLACGPGPLVDAAAAAAAAHGCAFHAERFAL
jgi:NAD(P)H-flavin reductase